MPNLYALAGAVVVSLCLGLYGGYRFELSAYDALALSQAKAVEQAQQEAANTQKAVDTIHETAAVREATAQQHILVQTNTITKEVDRYVPSTVACIPVGLVRVLNGAASGVEPSRVIVAAGQPDDACAPISWRSLANDLADDYGSARANAEQLNALEDDVRASTTAFNS